jgi:hypothetical protein
MAIEAPVSKHRRTNLKIYAAACIIFGVVFAYDGYLSKYKWSRRHRFYEKHMKDGRADETMIFNRVAPIFLLGIAVGLTVRFWSVKDKKLLMDESELIIGNKEKIPYASIQKIDKTHFDPIRGYFIVTYNNEDGGEVRRKISSKAYDDLEAVLEELVAKIS